MGLRAPERQSDIIAGVKQEDLQATASVRGILADALVTVVSVRWFGSDALELTYRGAGGELGSEILYRDDEARLEMVEQRRPWSFDADGELFRLVSEALRIVNGGGRIEREYALGRGRTDLLIVWPPAGRERRWVVECKVRRGDLERAIAEGIAQTRAYVDRSAAEAGHLIVFDRAPARSWEQKIFRREAPPGAGAPVTVWGM